MQWSDKFGSIIIYDRNRINKFGFDKPTTDFLATIGLPKDAAPFLSFVENNNIQYEGILKLTDYFDFLASDFDKYVVIGSNGNGDEIVIDIIDNCKIKLLDHEDDFSEEFMNSSIEKLFSSLMIYKGFIDDLQNELGEDALFENKYTDLHLALLKTKLSENDPPSMNKNAFWSGEIEVLTMNRDNSQ